MSSPLPRLETEAHQGPKTFSGTGSSFSLQVRSDFFFSCFLFHGNSPQHPPSSPGNSDYVVPSLGLRILPFEMGGLRPSRCTFLGRETPLRIRWKLQLTTLGQFTRPQKPTHSLLRVFLGDVGTPQADPWASWGFQDRQVENFCPEWFLYSPALGNPTADLKARNRSAPLRCSQIPLGFFPLRSQQLEALGLFSLWRLSLPLELSGDWKRWEASQ